MGCVTTFAETIIGRATETDPPESDPNENGAAMPACFTALSTALALVERLRPALATLVLCVRLALALAVAALLPAFAFAVETLLAVCAVAHSLMVLLLSVCAPVLASVMFALLVF